MVIIGLSNRWRGFFWQGENSREGQRRFFFHLRDRTVLPVSAGARSVFGAAVFLSDYSLYFSVELLED